MINTEELIQDLISAGCLKFGEFKLKNGFISPHYVDMREASLNVKLYKNIASILKTKIESDISGNHENLAIIGVPYGVTPLAGHVAGICNLPYQPVRKEKKDYGSEPNKHNFNYVIIEDVITSGSSILDTMEKVDGSKVTDVIVIVNREAGGEQNIKEKYPHVKFHSLITISQVMNVFNEVDPSK